MWRKLLGDLQKLLDEVRTTKNKPKKGHSSVNDRCCRHWPCTESVDGLHRGTPDSGWLSAHTDPLMRPPLARGWSTTSSQLVLSSLWGCRSMPSSGWLSPGGKPVKWLCVKSWTGRETWPIFKQPHGYRWEEPQSRFRKDALWPVQMQLLQTARLRVRPHH